VYIKLYLAESNSTHIAGIENVSYRGSTNPAHSQQFSTQDVAVCVKDWPNTPWVREMDFPWPLLRCGKLASRYFSHRDPFKNISIDLKILK